MLITGMFMRRSRFQLSLFQKTLILSAALHLAMLVVFALFVPSRVVTYVQVPVEVVALPPPPDILGEKQVSPPEIPEPVVETREKVKVYLPDAPLTIISEIAGYEGGVAFRELTLGLGSEDIFPSDAGLPLPSPAVGMPSFPVAGDRLTLYGPAGERGLLHAPLPRYPDWAREQGLEAYIELKLWIDSAGRINEISVLKSSGNPALDRICLETVRHWIFESAEEEMTWAVLPLRFHLI